MNTEERRYYQKTTNLLINAFIALCGDNSFLRGSELSDRKSGILTKAYGTAFSKENILFCDKFLIFAPSFVVTYDHLRSSAFDEKIVRNKILNFKDIKKIRYELMPCQTNIQIKTGKSSYKELFNGVPNSKTYADVKSYEIAVTSGKYKARTICYLATIYALTSLCNCAPEEYEGTYLRIESNIKKLIEYQKDVGNESKKYGEFFSFDFVTCNYDYNTVEEMLNKIDSVKEELEFEREEEREARKEQFLQTLERKFEETREPYENRE